MKQILTLILILAVLVPAGAQQKKRGKVKRKYRNPERIEVPVAPVFLRGKIRDADDNLLPGAHVTVLGTKKNVHANEDGEYFFYGLEQGITRIQVSFVGFRTKSVDFHLQSGNNYLNFTLDEDNIRIDEISVTAQKRNQQILDVPITVSGIDAEFMEDNNITELSELSEFVPGLQVRMQGNNRPSFVIRGLTSDEVSPAAQPRVSVFYNNVPVSRASGASLELFDMQQVEVLKGPQNTLFGRGAQIGAIHYITNKPTSDFYGNITAGIGDYNQREINGAINIPVIKNKLMVRAAGVYDYYDGFIDNTLGGKLNGKNTAAGRFSVRFLPTFRHKIDLVLNYQKDDAPGLGFMSMNYPNTEGSTNPFDYTASLEQGNNLATQRDIFDATLTMKQFNNENNFWTSTSSYHTIGAFSRWDGDGTAAAAIDMSEDISARQFYQELRYNFSKNNRLNGSLGGSFWLEKASQDYWFSTNEQDMFHLLFATGSLVDTTGQPVSISNLPPDPNLGDLGGLPLAENHEEENTSDATNRALEGFLDFTYHFTPKISATAGARVISERFKLSNQAQIAGADASTLGFLTGNYPNLLFAESDQKEIKESSFAYTYRGGLKYAFNENTNVFVNYSKGRRPKVLQFTSTGEEQVLNAETVDNYELGFKTTLKQRVWFDAGIFYQEYKNFQTSAWVVEADSGEFNYLVKDAGKATAYGAETSLKIAILKGLDMFGNYAYIHARFDSLNVNGEEQEYAENMFRLTPEHSFAVGLHARAQIAPGLFLFAVPSYSWRSKIYFEDANTPGLEQAEYGLLNFRGGVELPDQGITIAVFGTNLLEEEYIVSAGNTGSLFGAPTQIPGAPRMIGTKVTWKFRMKEKLYYQRNRWNR
ncbi:TonB-dependent receptor [Maribellus comscasis]|uniref:TonB-dependent receptor n=1 Tax=Maribellus comscasis TaxID=2681766 RepID=A0A6I6JLW9_9BACT|nr:TonB-dependent receptor [Maribellus comscasis]QGY43341.1 TonB-dependent receptor [Maribellus comscasis]